MPCDYWATAFNNPISLARYFPVPLMLAAFLFGLPSTNGITNTRIGASSFVYSWTKIRERFFLQKRNLPSCNDVLELPHSTRASFGETMTNRFPADTCTDRRCGVSGLGDYSFCRPPSVYPLPIRWSQTGLWRWLGQWRGLSW